MTRENQDLQMHTDVSSPVIQVMKKSSNLCVLRHRYSEDCSIADLVQLHNFCQVLIKYTGEKNSQEVRLYNFAFLNTKPTRSAVITQNTMLKQSVLASDIPWVLADGSLYGGTENKIMKKTSCKINTIYAGTIQKNSSFAD